MYIEDPNCHWLINWTKPILKTVKLSRTGPLQYNKIGTRIKKE